MYCTSESFNSTLAERYVQITRIGGQPDYDPTLL